MSYSILYVIFTSAVPRLYTQKSYTRIIDTTPSGNPPNTSSSNSKIYPYTYKAPTPLLTLPNELILHTASYLTPSTLNHLLTNNPLKTLTHSSIPVTGAELHFTQPSVEHIRIISLLFKNGTGWSRWLGWAVTEL